MWKRTDRLASLYSAFQVGEEVGAVDVADDAVVALQADPAVLVRRAYTGTPDQHLAQLGMLPGVLQLNGAMALHHALHGLVHVGEVALHDPAVPVPVAGFRCGHGGDAQDAVHGVVGQHLAVLPVGGEADDPQAHVQGVYDVAVVGAEQGPVSVFVPVLADPVEEEVGEDADLGVVVDGVAGVVHADEADGGVFVPDGHRDEPLDILGLEDLPLHRVGLPQGVQVVNDDGTVLVKQTDPACCGLRWDVLKVFTLGGHLLGTPLEGVAPVALPAGHGLEEVGPVGLVELAHRRQHVVHGLAIAGIIGEGVGIAHDLFGEVQLFLGALAHRLPLGDVQSHLQPQVLALVTDDFVLEEEVAAAVFVFLVPDVEGLLLELVVGAEGAGSVQTLEGLVALAPLIMVDAEEPLARRVEVIELVGVHIADVEDVVLGGQDHAGKLVLGPFGRGGGAQGGEILTVAVLLDQAGPEGCAVRVQIEGLQLRHRAGAGEEEALEQLRPQLFQGAQLFFGFDALAAHPDGTAVGQLQHVAQQPVVVGAVLDVADEAAVDLDLIDLHLPESAETGVAGAEVVHRDLDAVFLPLAEDGVDMGVVHELHALGEFDGQSVSRQAAGLEHPEHIGDDGVLQQLGVGHVDVDVEVRQALPPPAALGQCCLQHPQPGGADELGLLQDGDELRGGDRSAAGGGVAQQALGAVQRVGVGAHLGLVGQREAGKTGLDALLQILLQLQGHELVLVVSGGKEPEHVFSVGLGVVQGGLGILVEGAGIGDRVFPEGHAAAGEGTAAIHPPAHLVKNIGDILALPGGEEDGEAVAVDPVDPPGAVGDVLQRLGGAFENGVAGPAALLEVDGLEVVHPQHQQIAVDLAGQGRADLLLQALHVEGAGEVVGLAADVAA